MSKTVIYAHHFVCIPTIILSSTFVFFGIHWLLVLRHYNGLPLKYGLFTWIYYFSTKF